MVWKRGGSRHRNYPSLTGQVSAETEVTGALAQNRSLTPAASTETQGSTGHTFLFPDWGSSHFSASYRKGPPRPGGNWWIEGSWVMALTAV